jgi:hypothetical protein
LAETSTITVWPPHCSGTSPRSASSFFTRSAFASGLSILLIATRIGTPAALAWSIASRVCGITPSSAATTRMTTSVTRAPRARIIVKASWPGVSRNTTLRSLTFTAYAPMCCVMPPASRSATRAERMASSSVVLPWSTCPITVTTGARVTRSAGSTSSDSTCSISSSKVCILTSAPNSRAIIDAVSSSSVLLMVIISRRSISFLRTSLALTSSFVARSATVIPSASVIVRVTGGGATGATALGCMRGCSRRDEPPGRWLPGRWCIGGR